jgi:26S proteasome regulatory subunit T6
VVVGGKLILLSSLDGGGFTSRFFSRPPLALPPPVHPPSSTAMEIETPASPLASSGPQTGVASYFHQRAERLSATIQAKKRDLFRLQAQRNELNARVRLLRDELQVLQEPGSHVGEVVRAMGKTKVLVKVGPEGKYLVDIDPKIDIAQCTPNTRVALRSDSYTLHRILPTKVDPLVSLMRVEKVPDSTYDMVGGLDQQIREIKEVIELPIRHPELFEALGIAQPKGVLMYGPPGTGKTLLARAVAHHTDCQFIRVSGAELVQKYIGEGARMVRELFVMAREKAPTIIFMDEVDSIGSARSDSGGDSEVQRTMLELLNQLDGFEPSTQIKIIMATNRIDILDPALLRPGRIDRKIEFPPPNAQARETILKIHSKRMNLTRGIDLLAIAQKLDKASGAECKAVCTEAGMFALRERRVHVTAEDFELASQKVMKKSEDSNTSLAKLWR